jgi:hypothetical protein
MSGNKNAWITLFVTAQLAMATFAFSGQRVSPGAWSQQAERDAGTLVEPETIVPPSRTAANARSTTEFLRRIEEQVHDVANTSLRKSDRRYRRHELRRRIHKDLARAPQPTDRELAIGPTTDSDGATLQKTTSLSKNYSISSLSQPGIGKSPSIRAVTRLSLDRSLLSASDLSGTSSLTSSGGNTATDPISDADRLLRPIHGRPGIRPLPGDTDSAGTGTLPIGDNTRPTDTRINDGTRPAPGTGSGGSTRAPDRRNR